MTSRETIALDGRAQQRLYVLNYVLAGELSADQAGRILKLSTRQVRRLLDRYRSDGAAGLVHRNHGRSPAHRTPDELRDRLIELATTTYAGVNRAHLAELLAETPVLSALGRPVPCGAGLCRRSSHPRFPAIVPDVTWGCTRPRHAARRADATGPATLL